MLARRQSTRLNLPDPRIRDVWSEGFSSRCGPTLLRPNKRRGWWKSTLTGTKKLSSLATVFDASRMEEMWEHRGDWQPVVVNEELFRCGVFPLPHLEV